MNFKNITKIATAVLLFTGISAFAQGLPWTLEQRKRVYLRGKGVYLHIKNNTDYNFTLNYSGEANPLGTINAYEEKTFPQLRFTEANVEWAIFSTYFNFVSDSISINMKVEIDHKKGSVNVDVSNEFSNKLHASKPLPTNYRAYEYHIYLTLTGDKKNKFAGSSLKLEIKKIAEMIYNPTETSRLQQRLPGQPAETSLERLLQMKRR